MFISDLTYQEIAVEANNLEGANMPDFGLIFANGSVWNGKTLEIGGNSVAGPGGAQSGAAIKQIDISALSGFVFVLPT